MRFPPLLLALIQFIDQIVEFFVVVSNGIFIGRQNCRDATSSATGDIAQTAIAVQSAYIIAKIPNEPRIVVARFKYQLEHLPGLLVTRRFAKDDRVVEQRVCELPFCDLLILPCGGEEVNRYLIYFE